MFLLSPTEDAMSKKNVSFRYPSKRTVAGIKKLLPQEIQNEIQNLEADGRRITCIAFALEKPDTPVELKDDEPTDVFGVRY